MIIFILFSNGPLQWKFVMVTCHIFNCWLNDQTLKLVESKCIRTAKGLRKQFSCNTGNSVQRWFIALGLVLESQTSFFSVRNPKYLFPDFDTINVINHPITLQTLIFFILTLILFFYF